MMGHLPMNIASAYEIVVRECYECGRFDGSAKTPREYDIEKLIEAFKTIWAHDWMLDARLTKAEEIFASRSTARHTRTTSDLVNLKSSLEWMMQTENADRIARAFLYSRLSQHFGETDSKSVDLSDRIHAKLKDGNMASLGSEVFAATNIMGIFARWVGSDFAPVYSKFVQPLNQKALWASLPNILIDHTRILDGSWARQKLEFFINPRLAVLGAPKLVSSAG